MKDKDQPRYLWVLACVGICSAPAFAYASLVIWGIFSSNYHQAFGLYETAWLFAGVYLVVIASRKVRASTSVLSAAVLGLCIGLAMSPVALSLAMYFGG